MMVLTALDSDIEAMNSATVISSAGKQSSSPDHLRKTAKSHDSAFLDAGADEASTRFASLSDIMIHHLPYRFVIGSLHGNPYTGIHH